MKRAPFAIGAGLAQEQMRLGTNSDWEVDQIRRIAQRCGAVSIDIRLRELGSRGRSGFIVFCGMRRWLPYFQGLRGRYVFWNHLSEKLNTRLHREDQWHVEAFAKVARRYRSRSPARGDGANFRLLCDVNACCGSDKCSESFSPGRAPVNSMRFRNGLTPSRRMSFSARSRLSRVFRVGYKDLAALANGMRHKAQPGWIHRRVMK